MTKVGTGLPRSHRQMLHFVEMFKIFLMILLKQTDNMLMGMEAGGGGIWTRSWTHVLWEP